MALAIDAGITSLTGEIEGGEVMILRGRHVGLPIGEAAGGLVGGQFGWPWFPQEARSADLDLFPTLAQMTPHLPETPESATQPLGDLTLLSLDRPGKRRPADCRDRFPTGRATF